MSQSQLGDDDLFGEAAAEMREDVEKHLDAARETLPEGDDIWETEADNVLGVLNGLRSALDTGDAEDHLRQAKKWYTIGERADAFEDAEDLAAAIEDVEELLEQITGAHENVGELASTIPQLRGALDEAQEAADAEDEPEDDDEDDDEGEDETAADDEDDEDEEDEE
ncbi:hypothetical protein AUR64_06830 [Haloprofundus marisrubri]|uniref:Uncharacterized protein n=1 Tax=Haloprofundus marisrubri TaxID=1514971 RepID=A0A0W1RBY4_9EURY|nr:DUF5790 family protein [Haloprofundus marisrubri]KTG10890.1 hypothetical protein AUR64_06830 [Haloprofundus marisrubri]